VVTSSAPVSVASTTPAAASGGNSLIPIFKEKCFKNVGALLECTNNDIKNEHLLEGVNIYLEMLKN
jgi:hypothetical protein